METNSQVNRAKVVTQEVPAGAERTGQTLGNRFSEGGVQPDAGANMRDEEDVNKQKVDIRRAKNKSELRDHHCRGSTN